MKKRTRKLFALALAILMLLPVFTPVTAQAATYRTSKTVTLSAGQTASLSRLYYYNSSTYNTTYTYYYYKITLTAPKILTFTITGSSSPYAYLSNSLKYLKYTDGVISTKPSSYDYEYLENGEKICLDKGTYYLRVGTDCKAKYSLTTPVNKANYCAAKAITWSANKNLTIAQTGMYNYNRWYKITLSSKKQIAYQTKDSNDIYKVTVYNSKGRRLYTITNGANNKKCTEDKLPAGTYYICISAIDTYDIFNPPIVVKWYTK